MPEIHPTLPIGTGGNQNFSVTGGWQASVSGTTTVSGDTSGEGALSGPWLIEEQWLNLTYARVPAAARTPLQDTDVSLSGIGIVSGTILQTQLICRVFCHTASRKSYDYYATRNHQQPQKFLLTPEMYDYKGNAYGTVGEFSGSPTNQPLGPAGYVHSVQQFYNRRLWQASDSVRSQSTNAYSYQYWPGYVSVDGSQAGRGSNSFAFAFRNQDGWMDTQWQDLREIHMDVSGQFPMYALPGRYSYTQEINSQLALIDLLDTAGHSVTLGNVFWEDNAQTHAGAPAANHVAAHPDYDINRHDYT